MTQVIDRTGFIADAWAGVEAADLSEYAGGAVLLMPVDAAPEDAVAFFEAAQMIVIPFASSADGRGFSIAAALRGLGYRGHLRARGHVLVDQFRAALRQGFDDVEISDEQAARNPEAQWRTVALDLSYQSRLFAA
ncbi:DUF934 domain-containing protein [Rhodalgimonas zhirmunskyi]|uniref:DUF934 domain-containing protein n=1 Tax=Rhodalgimonas zhirmunskyi TaxID=2964767 RepID=A0AAJ1U8U1_9RHOB|nr:DUF934 domain-containing protein [Rhodoalgimonas zhirmunskyi]MDQ2093408.1 DUF934 domain-containing protein [Rhodoalgimonas zhirmunskyi]